MPMPTTAPPSVDNAAARGQQDGARVGAISDALSTIRPEHLHIALAALGLQHLAQLAPAVGDRVSQGLGVFNPDVPEPGKVVGDPNADKQGAAMSQAYLASVMKNQLAQALPENAMARVLQEQQGREQSAQNEKGSQLKDFLAAMEGVKNRAALSPNSVLSPYHDWYVNPARQ